MPLYHIVIYKRQWLFLSKPHRLNIDDVINYINDQSIKMNQALCNNNATSIQRHICIWHTRDLAELNLTKESMYDGLDNQ